MSFITKVRFHGFVPIHSGNLNVQVSIKFKYQMSTALTSVLYCMFPSQLNTSFIVQRLILKTQVMLKSRWCRKLFMLIFPLCLYGSLYMLYIYLYIYKFILDRSLNHNFKTSYIGHLFSFYQILFPLALMFATMTKVTLGLTTNEAGLMVNKSEQ